MNMQPMHLAAQPRAASRSPAFTATMIILAATLALQFPIVIRRAINWDEFFHYSQVVRLAHGTLSEPLQTLYTRAFVWVLDLPGTGVDHIIVIRLFMLACELVTLAAIVGMAGRFTDRVTAVLCAIAYVSMAYVFKHGTSFRPDAPAVAMLMSSAWILVNRKLDVAAIFLAGLLAGISTILTIKSVLYAPVFTGIAWLRWCEGGRRRGDGARLAVIAIWALVSAVVVYLLHFSTLPMGSEEQARGILTSAGGKMFSGNQLYGRYALVAALASPVVAAATLAAPLVIWRSEFPKPAKLALLGMWLPLTTLIFYHNTAPYYYAFMLPPVVVAAGPVFAISSRRYDRRIIGAIMVASALVTLVTEPENPIERQKTVQREATRMFPSGVAYFDSYALLGDFPKANVFMTPWGVQRYLTGEVPNMVFAMAKDAVPLLLNNDPAINEALTTGEPVAALLPGDLVAIRETYVPVWEPIWVAGRDVPAGERDVAWNVRVPGVYTVLKSSLGIDGRLFSPGQMIRLERGRHVLSTGDRAARLLWGENLDPPASPPLDGPLVMPF